MPDAPLVLGFDTATACCAVALVQGDEVLASVEEPMARGQAERLLGLCQDLLAESGKLPADLAAIGVGTGPGNFTGIRISVSAARGLALGLGIPAYGVNAFESLALDSPRPCAVMVPATRGQVFFQGFPLAGASTPPLLCAPTALPDHSGPLIGQGGMTPEYSTAVAIARIALSRIGSDAARPAPMYLRPADAAPARDTAPPLLT